MTADLVFLVSMLAAIAGAFLLVQLVERATSRTRRSDALTDASTWASPFERVTESLRRDGEFLERVHEILSGTDAYVP